MQRIQSEIGTNVYVKLLGYILIALAVVIFAAVTYHNSSRRQQPLVFSDRSMLDGLQNYHNVAYLDPNNFRTVDTAAGQSTTSEGESYTMLRAVWWNDKTTFDRSWQWTKQNLQHSNDHLFSWYYGKLPDGTFGINAEIGGNNSASDADTDIALALLFAHDRWGDKAYLDEALPIIKSIWQVEVIEIKGKPYLLADNLEKQLTKKDLLLNPSYLAPYAYKIFARYDKTDDWNGLADNSFAVLSAIMAAPLDKASSANLPPDWVTVNSDTAAISPAADTRLDTNFGYDALRVPFRLALDWIWFQDARDKTILDSMGFLGKQWNQNHALGSLYGHDGSSLKMDESPAMYGGTIGYFLVTDPSAASQIYNNKLKVLYTPDTNSWKRQLSYYDDNWAWFGMALYNKFTINLEQQQ